jgi:effector-binding domain-containing protein
MTRLIEVLISLAIVAALFLVISFVLPSSRHLTEQVETNRKLTIVYDTLNSVRRFKDWNPLVLRDPRMQLKLSGPDSGVGARLDYVSKNPSLGTGSWEIVASEAGKSVTYAITDPHRGHDKRSTFFFKPTGHSGRNIEITQLYDVVYGWDLVGRYAGLYVARHVGDDMKMGLDRLANLLTTVPNVDYRMQGSNWTEFRTVEVPAEHLLVVNAGSIARDPDKLAASMKANTEWIKRSMESSGLVAAGPMRIISTEFGRENYTFDVAQPVRRGGAAKAADKTGTDKTGADAEAAATVPVSTFAPLTGLKLLGPVKAVDTKAGRAAVVSYTGYLMGLENVHNALRAWVLTQGLEVVDRPWDVYKNGIDQAITENGQYDVYWTLK